MSVRKSGGGCPSNAHTGEPIGPLSQPGYYPGFSTLAQQRFWDARTREVILDRVNKVPPIRFFSQEESALLEVICDHIIPEDDRDAAHKIPIVPWIDKQLYEDRHDGYRFADMPPEREALRLGLWAIRQIADHLYRREFVALPVIEQDKILQSLHDGKPAAGSGIWARMPVHRFWIMSVENCVEVYYAHPWSWDEIGFGGPAYPRAYMRLENGSPEPWRQTNGAMNGERRILRSPTITSQDPVRSSISHLIPSEE